jgi:methylmalonyl-CoA/ethylmalonyl-CoA epimerase
VLPQLTRIDHVGIACRDLDQAIGLYQATFGLEVVSLEVNEEQGVREAMLRVGAGPVGSAGPAGSAGGVAAARAAAGRVVVGGAAAGGPGGPGGLGGLAPGYVQLLEPLSPDTPVGKFLARRGEGIHHIAYGVSDVRRALAEIGGTGIRLIDERPRHGSLGASIAFLHPADLGGVLTELVQPAGPE